MRYKKQILLAGLTLILIGYIDRSIKTPSLVAGSSRLFTDDVRGFKYNKDLMEYSAITNCLQGNMQYATKLGEDHWETQPSSSQAQIQMIQEVCQEDTD